MFAHIFKYRIKALSRNRSMLFWTLVFPILLATLYKMAFSGLGSTQAFSPIPVAVLDTPAYSQSEGFKETMEALSSGEERLFNLSVVSLEKAQESLQAGKIKGYIEVMSDEAPTPSLTVNGSGIEESIIKSFLDQYTQSTDGFNTIVGIYAADGTLAKDPRAIDKLLASYQGSQVYTQDVAISKGHSEGGGKMDMMLNYFYALIAMACMYGSFFGVKEVNQVQANISVQAARVNMAPVHKLKIFLYSGAAAYLVQLIEMLVLLLYIVVVLGIDFGDRLGLVCLTTVVGSLVGVSFGAFVSSLVRGGEGIKMAVILTTSMVGSMLAGMMVGDIKYLIATNIPILLYLNPVNLVADSFFALYFYTSYNHYIYNMMGLVIFAVVFCLGTYFVIRGRKYASL